MRSENKGMAFWVFIYIILMFILSRNPCYRPFIFNFLGFWEGGVS